MRIHVKPSPHIGGNVKKFRLEKKLTQEQLSAKIQVLGYDIPRGTLAKIETGGRHITADELFYFKTALNMNYEDFYVK